MVPNMRYLYHSSEFVSHLICGNDLEGPLVHNYQSAGTLAAEYNVIAVYGK